MQIANVLDIYLYPLPYKCYYIVMYTIFSKKGMNAILIRKLM